MKLAWAVLIGLGFLAGSNVPTWTDNASLWTHAVAVAPCSARGHWNLAQTQSDPTREYQITAELALKLRCR